LDYREEWEKLDTNTKVLLGYYPIQFRTTIKDSSTIQLLKNVLLSKSNYPMDSIYKKCYFTPEWGLAFFKNSDTTQVLVSERCQEWKFFNQDSMVSEDFDRSGLLIQDLRIQIFKVDDDL
jgi:hypothetical protein